ncbi:MAG: UDP-2,3-diacylglucosamine diphosphatase LpxI [Alphaproteobacteria bacterium]
MKKTLGIIAGGGDLPKTLAEFCQKEGRGYYVIAIEGCAAPEWVENHPHHWNALGQIGSLLTLLKDKKISQLVFAGAVKRPSFKTLKMDAQALKWIAKIGMKAFGDDGLFKGLIQQFEKEGFEIVGAHDVLGSILMPKGVLGRVSPTAEDLQDIQKGFQVAKALGGQDIGQAVIVEDGVVLSVEGTEGTEQLLCRTKSLKHHKNAGVLVKVSKPHQELRVDLPTIGPDTVKSAAEAGLRGIALEKGKGLILHQHQCIELANGLGLFLFGVE